MESEPERHPVLIFAVSTETHGVRLESVREIHRPDELQRVPLAPPIIRGISDVRGRMVTAVDLPAMLAGIVTAREITGHLLIVSEPRDHLALWVPTEIDLWNLDLAEVRARPAGDGEPDVYDGFVTADRSIVNLLSVEKLAHHCEREVLRRYRVAS